jgi:hypothetical protein
MDAPFAKKDVCFRPRHPRTCKQTQRSDPHDAKAKIPLGQIRSLYTSQGPKESADAFEISVKILPSRGHVYLKRPAHLQWFQKAGRFCYPHIGGMSTLSMT